MPDFPRALSRAAGIAGCMIACAPALLACEILTSLEKKDLPRVDAEDAEADDAAEVDPVEPEGDIPYEDVVDEDGDPDADEDPDTDTDTEIDGPPPCTGGPPVSFADGAVFLRELHVGAGQAYAAIADAAAAAVPGDRVVVHGGAYAGADIVNFQGTADHPMAVAGAAGETAIVGSDGMGLHLIDATWVIVENLSIEGTSGDGLSIDDGGDYATPAGPVVVRDVAVSDIGPPNGSHGIVMSGVDGFLVYKCRVTRWGADAAGLYMSGCHDGLVAGCSFTYAEGLDGVGDAGVNVKGGSRDIELRGNLFRNAGQRAVCLGCGSHGGTMRPADATFEAYNVRVMASVFIGSLAPLTYAACEGACLFAQNTVYRPAWWMVRILNESTDLVPTVRGGRVVDNIFVFGTGLHTFVNVGADTDAHSFLFSRNLWYNLDVPDFTMDTIPNDGDVVIFNTDPLVQIDPRFFDVAAEDFHLEASSLAVGAAVDLDERTLDFDERCYKDPATLGAFEQP